MSPPCAMSGNSNSSALPPKYAACSPLRAFCNCLKFTKTKVQPFKPASPKRDNTNPCPSRAAKSFRAPLERMDSPLKWVIVRIPFDVHKLWGKRGQLRIKGEINGFAFRTSLFPTGRGSHYLLVNKKMQAGGRTAPGMTARFQLEPDSEKRIIAEPAELKQT